MKKKQLGLALIIVPFIALPIILGLYAVNSFVLMSGGIESVTFFRTVSLTLSLLGLLSVFGIFIGVPLGFILLAQSKRDPQNLDIHSKVQSDPRYASLSPDQVSYIKSPSISAFFAPLVWALTNGMITKALLCLVPFYNIYLWIMLVAQGRTWSWEEKEWTSFEEFQSRQVLARNVIIGVFLLSIFFSVLDAFAT